MPGLVRGIAHLMMVAFLLEVFLISHASISREVVSETISLSGSKSSGKCECITEEICGENPNSWTRLPTGCTCYFDTSSTECACCLDGGCQCGADHPDRCVECGQAQNCATYSDLYTRSGSGCTCYFDESRSDCACCEEGGQCGSSHKYQCVKFGHGQDCGTYGDIWTNKVTGCSCYFDSSRQDCACCEEGGCQCPADNKHQCVQCGQGHNCGKQVGTWSRTKSVCQCYQEREALDDWTRTGSGCTCYFDSGSTDCACCLHGGCQCDASNRHICVQCGDGAACAP